MISFSVLQNLYTVYLSLNSGHKSCDIIWSYYVMPLYVSTGVLILHFTPGRLLLKKKKRKHDIQSVVDNEVYHSNNKFYITMIFLYLDQMLVINK